MTNTIQHGIYKCRRCGVEYLVNRGDTWDRCTPELCHACCGYVSQQYASVPVDKDGKDVAQ